LLLLAGANINAKNKQGQTPIEFNLANGSEALAEVLKMTGQACQWFGFASEETTLGCHWHHVFIHV